MDTDKRDIVIDTLRSASATTKNAMETSETGSTSYEHSIDDSRLSSHGADRPGSKRDKELEGSLRYTAAL